MKEVRLAILADWPIALIIAGIIMILVILMIVLPKAAGNSRHVMKYLGGTAVLIWAIFNLWTISVQYPGWPVHIGWLIPRLIVSLVVVCFTPAVAGWLAGHGILRLVEQYHNRTTATPSPS